MDNPDKISLLKELTYYSRLLEKHEAINRGKELKTFTGQQLRQIPSAKERMFHNYHVAKSQIHKKSFDHKYSFKKSNNLEHISNENQTVLFNRNQNFKAKYLLSKNNAAKSFSPVNKSTPLSNSTAFAAHKKLFVSSETTFDKIPCKSSSEVEKQTYNAKDFIKEIESLTELLKKKTSENQSKISSSTSKRESVMQNKVPSHTNYKYCAVNSLKSVRNETAFSKTKILPVTSVEIPISNTKYPANSKNCFTKINSSNKTHPVQLKKLNNKISYEKEDKIKSPNLKPTTNFLRTVVDSSKHSFQKNISGPVTRKVIFSDSKNISDKLLLTCNASVLESNSLSFGKQELVVKLNTTNRSVFSSSKDSRKSPNFLKTKFPNAVKSAKIKKLKSDSNRYIKINKHLTPPNKVIQLKHSASQKNSSSKKMKRKINSKYKVVNKFCTPNSNLKKINCLYNSVRKNPSLTKVESDALLKDLNDSAIDKLEKNLLAISTALTAPPSSLKSECNKSKVFQNSSVKVNSKLLCKKTPLRKPKTKISKYKIINISQKYSPKVKESLNNPKTGIRRIKQSKFSLVNKRIQPMHVITPAKQEKSVLVKRLFKSKNAIINKNASPVNYSAKMIKFKYLALNKRKSSSWQKQFSRMPVHTKFIATKFHPKQSRYQKSAGSLYHPRVAKKFISYRCHEGEYKMKVNERSHRIHSPVVYIRGMRYSLNSSGKTLRRLPVRGQTTKTFHKISSRIRTPENSLKAFTPISVNLASRVLHRSINRILTASTKKSLSKVNTYCMFYNRFGRCNRGVKCTYIHDPSKIAVCTRFLRGTCKIDGCPFSHEVDPGKMAICSFYLVGECKKDNCPYRHEKLSSNAVLCKDFVQGYCRKGKECKKAHILICPKYMQGECEEGSSCAFPHPPQKTKKNVQNMEDDETKPADVLLEKVFRYFQQGGDSTLNLQNESDEENKTNLFVPRQRRQLEEQPSFIPLCDSPAE